MATQSSILAWRILQTEEPGRLTWGHKESNMIERLTLHAQDNMGLPNDPVTCTPEQGTLYPNCFQKVWENCTKVSTTWR